MKGTWIPYIPTFPYGCFLRKCDGIEIWLITLVPAKYDRDKQFGSFFYPKGKEKAIYQEPPIATDMMTLERN